MAAGETGTAGDGVEVAGAARKRRAVVEVEGQEEAGGSGGGREEAGSGGGGREEAGAAGRRSEGGWISWECIRWGGLLDLPFYPT